MKVFICSLIEDAGAKQRRFCSEILLEEWGTSGKKRPRLSTLMKFLAKAQLYRAAEYVAVELLKGNCFLKTSKVLEKVFPF